MGRELKRVPIDFDWPQGEIWKGYLNPHYKKCPDCSNGYTQARERLEEMAHLLLVAGNDVVRGKTHPWSSQSAVHGEYRPGRDMLELTDGLAGRKHDGTVFGYDSCARWSTVKAIIKAAGLDPDTWGICPTCEGEAVDPASREVYEAWKDYDPPTGDGYQLWETTSEGSPSSPVFGTLEGLCSWCADNATTFGSFTATAEEWQQMLDGGFVSHQEGNMVFI